MINMGSHPTSSIPLQSDHSLEKPGGDRVHVCVMGWKWGHTGVVHVASLP
jgi:hypothetical protein